MTDMIYISIDRDQLTGGIQISINDKNGGYRIAGPKYCGKSITLLKHAVSERDVDEISDYLLRAAVMLRRAKKVVL